MPTHEPVTPHEHSAATRDEQDDWLEEPQELPPRPRRRLLAPAPLALLGVLLIACGFIGGVLVEKGETSSSSSTSSISGLASRFAASRGSGGSSAGSRAAGAGGGAESLFGSAGGAGRPTLGTVAYLAGSTLYVTDSEGNTVKVATSAGTSVSKTVKTSVKDIHPGASVTVTGTSAASGALNAESISVGGSGGSLTALFSGSGSRTGAGSGASGGGEPSLFGSGG